jgi:hypothetical protein
LDLDEVSSKGITITGGDPETYYRQNVQRLSSAEGTSAPYILIHRAEDGFSGPCDLASKTTNFSAVIGR